jgi:hypothetical protein
VPPKALPAPGRIPEDTTLPRLVELLGIAIDAKYGAARAPVHFKGAHPWLVTLRFEGRELVSPFFMGSAVEKEPTAADVLACLVSDARAGEQTFGEFCSDMGLDEDSIKARRTWIACRQTAKKIRHFLGDYFETVERAAVTEGER